MSRPKTQTIELKVNTYNPNIEDNLELQLRVIKLRLDGYNMVECQKALTPEWPKLGEIHWRAFKTKVFGPAMAWLKELQSEELYKDIDFEIARLEQLYKDCVRTGDRAVALSTAKQLHVLKSMMGNKSELAINTSLPEIKITFESESE